MGSTRYFLADLPARTTEQDLKSLFQDYGRVERVELKAKKQFGDADDTTKSIGFVTLQTDDPHYCLSELNWQKLHGAKLKVSLAKESFLDRLKRERDEGQQTEQEHVNPFAQSSSELLTQNTRNKRRVFGIDEEINDDDVAPELMITKKRASNSIHNGKIVIQQDYNVKPLHVIEHHKKKAKQQLDAKATIADLKRKESLNKMKHQYQQNKTAIQQALAGAGQAKKIKFSDAEEDDDEPQRKSTSATASKNKAALFSDEDDEDAQNIVLPQHKGKKGERLLEMQSKQSLDPRFRITSNFVEGEEYDENDDDYEMQHGKEAAEGNERDWQMGILEQVVGHKLDTANDATKAAKNKKMLRFDPGKEEHQKLLRQKPAEAAAVEVRETSKPAKQAPVSKSAFYMVTDTLKESLNMRGEGFSLLDMFGSTHDAEIAQRQGQLEQIGQAKILVNKNDKFALGNVNPFSYDSSDTEDEEGNIQEQQPQAKPSAKQKKIKIVMETFFIPKNDARLKEGAKLFRYNKQEAKNVDYEQVRNRLKLLISTKIAKTKKNLPGADIKKHKNKRVK